MAHFKKGDRVETAHGAHHALEQGTIMGPPVDVNPYDPNKAEWYGVEMDCGCCVYRFDWRPDGWGRIRAAH